MKFVINADDYGWSESCSRAIAKCFENGWITTTTTCANGNFFEKAVEMAKEKGFADRVGIHSNLTEGKALTEAIAGDPFFCDENGMFRMEFPRYRSLTAQQRREVYGELTAQAKRYLGAGMQCHHVDSHHHIHTAPFVTPIVLRVMREHGLTGLRLHRNVGNIGKAKLAVKNLWNGLLKCRKMAYTDYFGSFDDLQQIPAEENKLLEIMCHPDLTKDGVLVDRDGSAPYEDPFGTSMEERHKELERRGLSDEKKHSAGQAR